ncbi:MAG: hypothetical protein ACRBDL_02435 [Alphaproteobacteria bacterium]
MKRSSEIEKEDLFYKYGHFILAIVFCISLFGAQDIFAATKEDVYKSCKEHLRRSDAFCQCVADEPYKAYVHDTIERKKNEINVSRGHYEGAENKLLSDPTINRAQMEEICAVAKDVYIFEDTLPKNTSPRALPNARSQATSEQLKRYKQMQKQAGDKMHKMLHAGGMSSPVYHSMAYLSGFCKSRYDFHKKVKEHKDEMTRIEAEGVDVNINILSYNSMTSKMCHNK